jgi:phosphohistidine swiveling domain-containing protein
MVLTGYARRLARDLTPSQVIDPSIAAAGDPAEIAAACLVTVDARLAERVAEGDFLVLEGQLLAGEGAEAAVIALQAVGFAAVICAAVVDELAALGETFGIPVVGTAAVRSIGEGDLVRIDLERGQIAVGTARWPFAPLESTALAATRRAQLLARMRRVVEDEGFAE